jgi:hypothetical protein
VGEAPPPSESAADDEVYTPPTPLILAGVALLLAGGLAVGALFGGAQVAAEEENPTARFTQEAAALTAEVRSRAPDLAGAGAVLSEGEAAELRERLGDLRLRAGEVSVSVDLFDADKALHVAEFERNLRAGSWVAARRVVDRFSGRPEGMLLEARLQLAQGEVPAHEPLRALADAKDDELAVAARLLRAHLLAEESPEEALEVLRERVPPHRAEQVRARVALFLAVTRLDAQALEISLANEVPPATRRKATLQVILQGQRVARERPLDVAALEKVLRLLVPLRADAFRDHDAARGLVGGALEGVHRQGLGSAEAGVLLVEHLAEAGLRARSDEGSEAGVLLDAVCAGPPAGGAQATLRGRLLLALARLGARVERPHLRGLTPAALEPLPVDVHREVLAARLRLAAGEGEAEARAALRALVTGARAGRLVGPERGRALLEASRGLPVGEAAPLVERGLALDPGCPWLRLRWVEVLAEQGHATRALREVEGAFVLFQKVTRRRLGEEEGRIRFLRGVTLVHAARGDEVRVEVYLDKLRRLGDPEVDAVAERAAARLGSR